MVRKIETLQNDKSELQAETRDLGRLASNLATDKSCLVDERSALKHKITNLQHQVER